MIIEYFRNWRRLRKAAEARRIDLARIIRFAGAFGLKWVNEPDVALNPLGEVGFFADAFGRRSGLLCLVDLRYHEEARKEWLVAALKDVQKAAPEGARIEPL